MRLPNQYVEIEQEEMMYLNGGALSSWDKAWIVGAAIAGAVVLGVAIWAGAWYTTAKIMGFTFKVIILNAGAAPVVSTIIAAIGISSAAAWNIVNFA